MNGISLLYFRREINFILVGENILYIGIYLESILLLSMFHKEVKKHIAHNEYKRAIYGTIIST